MKLRTRKANLTIEIGDVTVKAQPLTPEEIGKLRDKFILPGRDNELNESGFAKELFCKIVQDIKGAVDEDGKEIICNDAVKAQLYEFDQPFTTRVLEEIRDYENSRIEGMAKN